MSGKKEKTVKLFRNRGITGNTLFVPSSDTPVTYSGVRNVYIFWGAEKQNIEKKEIKTSSTTNWTWNPSSMSVGL